MAKKIVKSDEMTVPKMDSFTELTGSFRGHMLVVQGSVKKTGVRLSVV